MSQLRFPLKHFLRDPVDEAALCRVAKAIDARPRREKRQLVTPLALGAVAASVALIVLFSHLRHDAEPLRLADGRDFVTVDTSGAPRDIPLSDGSRIRLASGSRIEPLDSSSTAFSAILTEGSADFDVRPGGPRRWVIECGLAAVEVVGTAFSCERSSGRLRVAVRRGVVLVRGEHVPDRARRLSAGETLDIEDAPLEAPTDPLASSPRLGSGIVAAPISSVTDGGFGSRGNEDSTLHPPTTRTWRELARRGNNGEAYDALGAEGFRSEARRLGVNDLLALADVARLSGHPAEAVVPLDRILREFSDDAQAPLAAFALGRLQLDSLGRPQAAVAAFQRALSLGIPSGLREDTRARLVEACARSGDPQGAQRAADAYLDEFPHGRYVRAVQGWLHPR
jgi:transmembrane sensor